MDRFTTSTTPALRQCHSCGGGGYKGEDSCETCGGTGRIRSKP